MRWIDISMGLLHAPGYPGEPQPKLRTISAKEDRYLISELNTGVHAGTHIDAPMHLDPAQKGIEEISLNACIGPAEVVPATHAIDAKAAQDILQRATTPRILLQGEGELQPDGAAVFAQNGIVLIGCEGITIGQKQDPYEVHKILLRAGIVILENLNLQCARAGKYFLFAPPLLLHGAEGAPCRAVLAELCEREWAAL